MAALVTFVTWISGTLTAAVVGLVQPLINSLPPMQQQLPDIGLWLFGLFVAPYLTPILAALLVRFVIRRLPFIG